MTDIDDEGMDFAAEMQKQFSRAPQGATTEARLKAERRAGMTPKQRAKRAKKPHALNFRASDETFKLVTALMAKLDADKTGVLERAVAALAKKEGVKVSD